MAALIEVTDPDDPRLADYRDLRDVELRKHLEAEHGLFLAEGEKVVRRAVEGGFAARSFLMAPRWLDGLEEVLASSDAPCYVVSEDLAEAVTGFHVHRGALASLERTPLRSVEEVVAGARTVVVPEDVVDHTDVGLTRLPPTRRRIAVLEDLVDHANVGAAFRNAAALGVEGVLLSPRCADPLYRRAIKVSMGAVLQIPWTRVDPWPDGLAALMEHEFTVVAMTLAKDAVDLDELVSMEPERLALVFGTEGSGVTPETASMADLRVRIPMAAGVDSLNVAAATAVAFYATR
ncbi:RNA methyltransferase [Nocardioides sp. WL0053]|uniref:RNA methyltransferase n=1 Tax=Nocardioides jiangsuensis TaxID=2866161 RepID=A0ABS7RG12_9ACTN|nr:RNA methyltransferase [Nocardioides jiangsuensis]MBY9073437.1 RNA methyltransferase [Nocardioides jiangsuensis]